MSGLYETLYRHGPQWMNPTDVAYAWLFLLSQYDNDNMFFTVDFHETWYRYTCLQRMNFTGLSEPLTFPLLYFYLTYTLVNYQIPAQIRVFPSGLNVSRLHAKLE